MNSRESAVARDESVKGARWALLHEKSDPLLRRYLGASLILQSDGSLVYDGICDFYVHGDRQADQSRTFNGTILPDDSRTF